MEGAVADTREEERLREELARSEARFRDVIERNADAIFVVDRAGAVRFCNPAAERLFERTREDLGSRPFGFPLVNGETTELDLPLADGRVRIVEMRVVASEWEGEDAFLASLRDVTERREAEAAARQLIREQAARAAAEEAAHRLRFLADAGALLTSSLDHRTTLSTLAQLCARELGDWSVVYVVDTNGAVGRMEVATRDPAHASLGRELRDLPIPEDAHNPAAAVLRSGEPLLRNALTPGELAELAQNERHLELMRALGTSSILIVPLIARERPVGALALASSDPGRTFTDQDVALMQEVARRAALGVDNARLYHEARAATRAMSELLAVISHDLRTPLSAIIGYADLLCMGVPEPLPDGSRQQVERIRTATRHLLYLIEELLAFARLDAGPARLTLEDVPAFEVAGEVAEVLEPLAEQRGLALVRDFRGQSAVIRTDRGKLRQALVNLGGNAVKFTEEGEVRFIIEVEDGTVAFRVRDTGPGIPMEHLEQIFQPFWQIPRGDAPRSASAGTGLGLSVVRRLVRMLGGEIAVESQPGRGSEFTIRLPRRPLAASDAQSG